MRSSENCAQTWPQHSLETFGREGSQLSRSLIGRAEVGHCWLARILGYLQAF